VPKIIYTGDPDVFLESHHNYDLNNVDKTENPANLFLLKHIILMEWCKCLSFYFDIQVVGGTTLLRVIKHHQSFTVSLENAIYPSICHL
jgi:hypothetical protein